MASRFVELNEAAQLLGLSPEQLVEKRSSGDIRGYRDGASWKFKIEDIEQYKRDQLDGTDSSLRFDDGLDDLIAPEPEADSLLVTEDGEEPTAKPTSSTIIGKSGVAPQADSDLKLSSASDLALKPEVGSELSLDDLGSELSLDAGAGKKPSSVDSDVALVPGVGTDSDVRLVPDTGSDKKLKGPAAPSADVLGDSELRLQSGSSGGTGPLGSASAIRGGSGRIGSGDLDISLDSELALSDDDDMVIGGSGVGSDLTLNPADSGINLASPTDSGLSLEADSGISLQTPTDSGLSLEEEPMDMGGSSISSLELPEDESIELDAGSFDSAPEPAQNLKKDEDFLLTPSDEMFVDESDSGSQVIALEDSVAFEQEGALVPDQGALLADTAGLDQQLDALGGGGAATPAGMAGPAYAGSYTPPEAPYSLWNIAGLLMILMFLSVSGVLMTDMVKNMWAWEDGMDVATGISEGVTAAFGFK